jgi:alkyl hydroperoxide reductase subunit AhpC
MVIKTTISRQLIMWTKQLQNVGIYEFQQILNILVFFSKGVKVVGVCYDKKFHKSKWRWRRIENSDIWIILFNLVIT